jgi:lysophospholipase L1-like esterase
VEVTRFVALGDSFTEGLDDLRPDGTPRGWADLVADVLATTQPALKYANLAVRSLGIDAVADHQVPAAAAMNPDLASVAAGANELLSVRVDVDRVVRRMDEVLAALTATGAQVIVFAGFDPRAQLPTGRLLTGRTESYNIGIRAAAARHGAHLIDLWTMEQLSDPRLWAPDRLHLSAIGHRHIAAVVLDLIGHAAPADWRVPADEAQRRRWLTARAGDLAWSWEHFRPWVIRKIRGRSMGDGRSAKYPELTPWRPDGIDAA